MTNTIELAKKHRLIGNDTDKEFIGFIEAFRKAVEADFVSRCEPILYINENYKTKGDFCIDVDVSLICHEDNNVTLYTLPQQPQTVEGKEWVGLSDAEIHNIYNNLDVFTDYVDFSRAIEAKLKQLNTKG